MRIIPPMLIVKKNNNNLYKKFIDKLEIVGKTLFEYSMGAVILSLGLIILFTTILVSLFKFAIGK